MEVVSVCAWIKSLRLFVCILAGSLAIAGFRIADVGMHWGAVAAVFFVTSATMLQNDWRDKFHDARKGKMLALLHQRIFLVWLMTFWIASAGLIAVTAIHNGGMGVVLTASAFAGLIYSEMRKVPFVPTALVSLIDGKALRGTRGHPVF